MGERELDVQFVSPGLDRLPEENKKRIREIFRKMYENYPDLFDYPEDGETEQNTQKSCQRVSVEKGIS